MLTAQPLDLTADTFPTRDTAELREERLPFTIRIVQGQEMLDKALNMRQSAYGRHVPELARQLGESEVIDRDPGAVVLLAESKLDGEAVGTMRIQTNRHNPLWLEQSVTLPEWLQGRSTAEATRLGVAGRGLGRMAKTVLFKAYYQYCAQAGIEWMVIAGRSPLDRQYQALQFQDVFPERGFIPMRHAGNIPHRVLAMAVDAVEPTWKASQHPLYDFFFKTRHPDIEIDVAAPVPQAVRGHDRVVQLYR